MEFLMNHTDLLIGATTTILVAILPPVNRLLDKVTSKPYVKDLFWLIERVEDGKLTKADLEDIISKSQKYTKD